MDKKKYDDIGYHFLIGTKDSTLAKKTEKLTKSQEPIAKKSQEPTKPPEPIVAEQTETLIYEGRPVEVVGAHVENKNTSNVGVCVIGNYEIEEVHSKSYEKLIDLLAWLCCTYKIHPNEIRGHRDFKSTDCPGKNLYSKLSTIREDVIKKLEKNKCFEKWKKKR